MALSKDEGTAAGRGRNLDRRDSVRSGGAVLYRSVFDTGMDGWIDHWNGYGPALVISRTSEMCYRGSHSLMLSTGEHPSPPADDVSSFVAAFKRLNRHDAYRYHSVSAYLAVGVGNYNGAWDSFYLYIDTQRQDNANRSFYQVRCSRYINPNHLTWMIRGDTGATPEQKMVAVPGSAHSFIGNNENKLNFQYVRLTVDLQANSGAGGYKELQVGNQVFDLSGLGAGSSVEPIQGNTGLDIDDFAGGFNIGFGLYRNISTPDGCQLLVDDVVLTASNTY